ncbi:MULTISPECIES: HAD family hydrolase [Bacillaceae]|uniref:Phosphoglycolate phosphatase n=1 Tax=Peribacillus huizhouensis TaxID=1501239 RepID=A0ABR6CN85_9BACI|nr:MULTISPECIES: HAD family hydrolase [Bacillaceae]MBA9026478.1 phosphoglycolate phosphatase [Peribacillus huizhouensis]
MIDSIIFDLDGTLWDTTHIGAQIWSDAASNYRIRVQVTADQLKGLYGLPVDIIAKRLFPDASDEVLQAIMQESSRKQCQYLEEDGGILFPRLIETLNELKKNYRLFIVSNCEEGYIQSFIKGNQLEGYFEDFEYPGRTGLSKADNIRMIIDRNHLKNPIYVGDTTLDATSSKEAGIPFVYAKYGFGNVEKFDDVIDSLNELNQLSLLKI